MSTIAQNSQQDASAALLSLRPPLLSRFACLCPETCYMAAGGARPRRKILLGVALAAMLCVSVVTPARATNTGWDADDITGRLDLRWVGVYWQDSETVRMDISLWGPVRRWMLNVHPTAGPSRSLSVRSIGLTESRIYGTGHIFFSEETERWVMEWADTRLEFRAQVLHLDPYLFQVWFPAENRYGARIAENAWGLGVTSCERLRSPNPACDEVPGHDRGLDP